MKYLSTFTGIGGFELGIIKAYEDLWKSGESKQVERVRERESNTSGNGQNEQYPSCIGYSEIDKYAIQIYEKHFKQKNFGDITKLIVQELPDFDLLVAGFPCQSFSIAGKRRGFDDVRGTLFYDIARILKEKTPKNFLLENVKGLLSHDSGRTFRTIIRTLTELGYCVEWQVLNAKNFGVPQNRERVFIVGHLGGIPERKVFPIGEGDGEYTNNSVQGTTRSYTRPIFRVSDSKESRREIQSRYKIRRLTPLECERLMAYPDGWTEGLSDTQRYKTLGNGIVSNVVAEVVKRLYYG